MLASARERIEAIEEEIRLAMVETDPNDDKNVIIEIQGGAGGEEAGLWAGDIYRMLTKYAERRGFSPEALEEGEGKFTLAIKGDGAYSVFKYEGGTHRVQRVPVTESQGRIHTSTATVAVLPEAEDVDVHIDQNDLQVDVYRSSGPGGQSVNTTDSAVRITHKPTGVVVSMQDEKSQLQNREKALRVLRARLYDRALAEQQAELAADRRAQVGTGDRAEKIRTYNFPERRVTDHRVKVTVHDLDRVLEGELDEFTAALEADEKRRRLAAQAERPTVAPGEAPARGGVPVRDALDSAVVAISASGSDTARLDAELLLAHVLGVSRSTLFMEPGRLVAGTAIRQFQDLVRRRSAGHEPVAYLLGRKGFRHIELEVDARVLVPRPETELLVEIALDLPAGARVIDVGTGSGAVALALARRAPRSRGHRRGRERRRARRRAREPRAAGALRPASSRPTCSTGSARTGTRSSPTRRTSPTRTPRARARRSRPRAARRAVRRRRRARRHPRARAAGRGDSRRLLAIEVGAGQAPAVAELARSAGFTDVTSARDLAGIERVVVARRA